MFKKQKVSDQLAWADKKLAQAGFNENRMNTARLLMDYVLSGNATAPSADRALMVMDRVMEKSSVNLFQDSIMRRIAGETPARITGWREFWSLPFQLNEGTLEPRPETETIVDATLKYLKSRTPDYKMQPWRIFDLGTGCGCIIIALLHELPNAIGFAGDISPRALEAVQSNAALNGVSERLHLLASDWAQAIGNHGTDQKFDVVVANPPYIADFYRGLLWNEVVDCDPPVALWGGPIGLDPYMKIVPEISRLIKPDGFAIFEMAADQADAVGQIIHDHGLNVKEVVKDLAGHARCISMQLR